MPKSLPRRARQVSSFHTRTLRPTATSMEASFRVSATIIGQLARKASRTPPVQEDPPFHYIDNSLAILGRTLDTHDIRLEHEFLSQRTFIASQVGDFKKAIEELLQSTNRVIEKVGERVQELEKSIGTQSRKMDQKIDQRSQTTDSLLSTRLNQSENASRNFLRAILMQRRQRRRSTIHRTPRGTWLYRNLDSNVTRSLGRSIAE